MKKVKKIEFINDYNRMSLEAISKDYGASNLTIEKYARVLELKPKRKKTSRHLMITDLNEVEIDRFRRISYGPAKDWRLNKKGKARPITKDSDNGGSDNIIKTPDPYKMGVFN